MRLHLLAQPLVEGFALGLVGDQLGELTTVLGQGDQHRDRAAPVGHLDLFPVAHSIEVAAHLITKLAYTDLLCHDYNRTTQ